MVTTTPTPIPSAPSSKKHTCLSIIGIFALIAVAGLTTIVITTLVATTAPTNVAREFIQDIVDSKIDQAYALTSTEFQQNTSVEDIKTSLAGLPDLTKISAINLTDRKISDTNGKVFADIKGTVTTPDNKADVEVILTKESGWKITTFNIKFQK